MTAATWADCERAAARSDWAAYRALFDIRMDALGNALRWFPRGTNPAMGGSGLDEDACEWGIKSSYESSRRRLAPHEDT